MIAETTETQKAKARAEKVEALADLMHTALGLRCCEPDDLVPWIEPALTSSVFVIQPPPQPKQYMEDEYGWRFDPIPPPRVKKVKTAATARPRSWPEVLHIFCSDGDRAWCKVQREHGRCVLVGDLPPEGE